VTFEPIAPQRLEGLPAGPTSTLRLHAVLGGTNPTTMPAWVWTIEHLQSQTPVTASVVENDAATVQFPLLRPGNYRVTATASAACLGTVTVSATLTPVAQFWVRVTPPRNSKLPPLENVLVQVAAMQPRTHNLPFNIGVPVPIDPQNTSGTDVIRSYVRITSPRSTVRLEGHTDLGVYTPQLDTGRPYEVLVIPDGMVAPQLFTGTPEQLVQNGFKLDPGIAISGRMTSGGTPVQGARILLRTGALPSTPGLAAATGRFQLRARAGDYAATIIPPADSGLPEARIVPGGGLIIYPPAPPSATMDFEWSATETSMLDLTVHRADGTPVSGPVHVRIDSEPGQLPRVGTLILDGQFHIPASGVVHLEDTSDARGALSFAALPRVKYIATLTPLDGTAAIATVPLDLTGAADRVSRTARLARKVSLRGRLLPASLTAGATISAIDPAGDPILRAPSSPIDASGNYALAIDPGRTYSLVVEANPTRSLPRTFVRTIVAPVQDAVRDDLVIPPGLPIEGVVTDARGAPIAGALIEAYCVGGPPACVDVNAPDTSTVRPTAEAVSDDRGSYRLLVPDPAIAN
jgi:hypothetical protein